jgi:WD40 repeat protein
MPPFDPTKIASKAVFKHPETFLSVCVDHDSGAIYCGSYDRGIHRFKLDGDKLEAVARWEKHESYVSSLALVRVGDRRVLVSGGYDGALVWSDAESGEVSRRVTAHAGWLRRICLPPGGERLVTVGDDMLVKLWETKSGALIRSLEGHAKKTPQGHVTALYAVAVSPDGKYVATGDRIGDVRVWEIDDGRPAANFQVPVLYTYDPRQRHRSMGGIRSLAFSPDGRFLAAGGIGQVGNVDGLAGPATVEIWDWKAPRRLASVGAEKHKALINCLVFHPTAPWLIGAGGGGDNGLLAFWKLDELPRLAATSEPPGSPRRSPGQGNKDSDSDAPGPFPVHRIKFDGHAHDFSLSPDATLLYVASYARLEIWRLS